MATVQEKVFLVSQRWTHHAAHSGYDRLGNYIGTPLTSKPVPEYLIPKRFYRKMILDMPAYDRTSLGLELVVFKHMATHKRCLYHFLYGESGYRYLSKFNGWRGHKLVVTYHKPPLAFAEMMRNFEHIIKLSAVMVVGHNQLELFRNLVPEDRLFLVPHPVDTTFFSPPDDFGERERDLCLFVGAHLRDFQTLRSVIENAWIIAPDIRFAVVVHPLHIDKLKGVIGNFKIFCNIDEAELLDLYRRATLLTMPLKDTTANNSVLEAMSCGTPMIVTDVGAIRDYVDDESACFVSPFESGELLDAILRLVGSNRRRKEMAEHARARAKCFDWKKVAGEMGSIYTEILGNEG